jgi:hypothetical protein
MATKVNLKPNIKNAIDFIEKDGVLLVYPITNQKEPASLWSRFFPRKEMVWEWDDESDSRVADLWHLKTELSGSGKVVYAKWFRGRATFFSKSLFEALLAVAKENEKLSPLSRNAEDILSLLQEDSPLSTKEIKIATDLRGRSLESTYTRAMKELWTHLLIVGYGEKDDGAFPSLAMGATQSIFEDLYLGAEKLPEAKARERLSQIKDSKVQKFIEKIY